MKFSVIAIAACVFACAAAQAQSSDKWEFFRLRTTNGCEFLDAGFHDQTKVIRAQGGSVTIRWEGSGCVSGQLINGGGKLVYDYVEQGQPWQRTYDGRMINGVWHGTVNISDTYHPQPRPYQYDGGCEMSRPSFIQCTPHLATSASSAPAAAPSRPISTSDFDIFAADQLYAAARDLMGRGELDMARLARDALARRFPQSPLVPLAADLFVSNAPAGSRPVAAAPAAAFPSVAAPAVAGAAPDDFQSKLNTFGAGQLFALADELDQQGQFDRARATRRALISRFPDSQLAATAAEQLAAASAQPPPLTAAPAPAAKPVTPPPTQSGSFGGLFSSPRNR